MSEMDLLNLEVGNHVKYRANGRVYMVIKKIGLTCFKVINPLCVGFTDYDFITLDTIDKWVLLND